MQHDSISSGSFLQYYSIIIFKWRIYLFRRQTKFYFIEWT